MAYRDDLGALRTRLKNLEQEQSTLSAKKRELEEATARLEELDGELADVRNRFEKERRLPLLDGVRIATPCPAKWEDMIGDERVRFCGQCAKNVYNVIALTREEAEGVIREHEGDVCMRLYRRRDGTILTADCPVGVKRKRRRRLVAGAVVSAAAGLAATYQSATTVMGGIEAQTSPYSYDDQVVVDEEEEILPYAGVIGSAMPMQEPAPEPSGRTGLEPDFDVRPDATRR